MPNVLNPEPESITLNTELETPTLEPATEFEHPSSESTSNPETAQEVAAIETPALDADAPTEPVAEAVPVAQATIEATHSEAVATEQSAQTPAAKTGAHGDHSGEPADDFSAALAAFEREQAAEAAAVEAYGDKVVSGTVIK